MWTELNTRPFYDCHVIGWTKLNTPFVPIYINRFTLLLLRPPYSSFGVPQDCHFFLAFHSRCLHSQCCGTRDPLSTLQLPSPMIPHTKKADWARTRIYSPWSKKHDLLFGSCWNTTVTWTCIVRHWQLTPPAASLLGTRVCATWSPNFNRLRANKSRLQILTVGSACPVAGTPVTWTANIHETTSLSVL